MKKFLAIAILFVLSVNLNAQNPFRIKVVDAQTSENVEKAYIFIEEIPLPDQETDKYGVVSFQNVPDDRKVRVNVRKVGYLPKQVEIVANTAIKVDNNIIIKLDKEPTTPQVIIWGEVTDKVGNEIENATVEVTVLGKPYTAKTDESGNYQIRIEGDVLKSVPSFQIEAKKNGCERSKTTETVPKTELINKDIILECQNKQEEKKEKKENPPPPPPPYLAQQTLDDIKLTIDKFEQVGGKAKVYYTLENMSASNQVRNVQTHWDFNQLTDQEGREYSCENFGLGNKGGEIDLIYQTPVKCYSQFNIGGVKVTRAAKLIIGGYDYSFQFINLKL